MLILLMVCESDQNCEIPSTVMSQYFNFFFFSGGCSYPTPQLQIQCSWHESFQVWSSLGYPKRNNQLIFRIWGGKSRRERGNVRETRIQKGHQITQEENRARELRVSQTLGETHRKKVTRLGKGLGRQNSILFSSLLALVFQSGRKYSKPGRQHALASWVQPGEKASLSLLSPLRTVSSQTQHP